MADEIKKIRVTLKKSLIGRLQAHKDTIRCLGLNRINSSAIVEAKPATLGMINKVAYLLAVEEVV
jgi:large subunit ribosomal protein L30